MLAPLVLLVRGLLCLGPECHRNKKGLNYSGLFLWRHGNCDGESSTRLYVQRCNETEAETVALPPPQCLHALTRIITEDVSQ